MLPSVPLFQMGKFFKQLAGCSSFDAPHDFARHHIWRRTHQYMHMVFTHNSTDYPYFKRLARLSDQLSNSFGYIPFQGFIATFGYP